MKKLKKIKPKKETVIEEPKKEVKKSKKVMKKVKQISKIEKEVEKVPEKVEGKKVKKVMKKPLPQKKVPEKEIKPVEDKKPKAKKIDISKLEDTIEIGQEKFKIVKKQDGIYFDNDIDAYTKMKKLNPDSKLHKIDIRLLSEEEVGEDNWKWKSKCIYGFSYSHFMHVILDAKFHANYTGKDAGIYLEDSKTAKICLRDKNKEK